LTDATLATQRTLITTLAQADDDAKTAAMKPPALIVVGKNVAFHAQLDWFRALSNVG
jgi:siroheme synthase